MNAPAQLALFGPTARERWETFHAAHPEVWRAFEATTLRVIRAGKRVTAKGVWERIRFDFELESTGNRGPKLNNDLTPHYARHFNAKHPEFGEFFRLRKLRS